MKISNREMTTYRFIFLACLYWLLGLITGLLFLFRTPIWIGVSILSSFAILAVLKKTFDGLDSNLKGIEGEFKVSSILDGLSSNGVRNVENVVLKNGHGDIDHVVVAKSGVWVIETKNISGTITFRDGVLAKNGMPFSKNFLQQTFAETKAVREFLDDAGFIKVPVRSVLVFAGKYAKVHFGQKMIDGAYVIGAPWLSRLITNVEFDVGLSSAQIEKIIALVRHKAG